ncbi:MAG: glycosyltransferase [Prevotella sp.]|nr:glycosyltransferase [Prevotella sp.]
MSNKISIIIPVYHVEKYIERCVLSVLKQTYRPLEVVFDFYNLKSLPQT